MVDDQKVNGADKQPTDQQRNQQLAYSATASLAAQANLLLSFGFTVSDVVNVLCDVACNLLSAVEPAQLRQTIIAEIRKNLPGIVDRHYQMRHTTPGGLIVPGR